MKNSCLTLLCICNLLLLPACSESPDAGNQQKPMTLDSSDQKKRYLTINAPLQYFTQRLAGDHAEVILVAPPHGDPATWQPTIDKVIQLQSADLVIFNGAGYSPWRNRVTLKSASQVISANGFREQWIPLPTTNTHSHGFDGEHSHSGYAITTWMNPRLALLQATSIATAIKQQSPDMKVPVDAQLELLKNDLQSLDNNYEAAIQLLSDTPLLYSHPVYQYFEKRYRVNGKALHWEANEPITDEQMSKLSGMLNHFSARAIIWEDPPLSENISKLASMGLESAIVRPQANIDRQDDWLRVQQQNVRELQALAQRLSKP